MGAKPLTPELVLKAHREGIERKVARLYTNEIVAQLAKMIEPFVDDEARQSFPVEIRHWAAGWLSLSDTEKKYQDPGLRAARRKSLARLGTATEEIWHAYYGLADDDLIAVYEGLAQTKFLAESELSLLGHRPEMEMRVLLSEIVGAMISIRDLGRAAVLISELYLPKRGRPKNLANRIACRALSTLYSEMTGRDPTISIAPETGKAYGVFSDFAIEALKPNWGEVTADAIRSCVRP